MVLPQLPAERIPAPVIAASIAALPAVVTLVLSITREGFAGPKRSRKLDDAQKLVAFAKSWTDAAASAGVDISASDREALRASLLAAAENARDVAERIRQDRIERRRTAFTGLVLPRWPSGVGARIFALVYYYLLLAIGARLVSLVLMLTGNHPTMTEPLTPGYLTIWMIQLLLFVAAVPFARRRAIMLDTDDAPAR